MSKRYRHAEKHKTPLSHWAGEFEREWEDETLHAPPTLLQPGKRYTYTIMADCGVGEFLWCKDSDDSSCWVGGNAFSLMDERWYPADVTPDLFIDLCQWVRKYMRADPRDWSLPRDLDWDEFHQEGLALARRLKAELGDAADVQYVRPWDDPDRERGELTAITLTGTLKTSLPGP